MYKNYTRKPGIQLSCFQKILLVMRLTTVILIAAVMQVSASSFAQRVTFVAKDVTLKQLFREIKKQTGYHVIWSTGRINPGSRITVDFRNTQLDEVLKTSLAGQSVAYAIDKQTIVIKEREPSFLDKLTDFFAYIDIRGRILDEKGMGLPGATIKVKGSSTVVLTNNNGEFRLQNVNEDAVLVISFLGYKTKEVAIKGQRTISVGMEVGTAELEELSIVSTGYQTLSKERATGAFNVIGKEQLEKPATSIAQRLIGTTAGMQATLDENGNPRFEIRGQTSLNVRDSRGALLPTAAPLVVVDGFAVQGDFSTINPNDVESVTVLKDASAASIWGAKSANGVIVVVTKKGRRNNPLKVNLSAFARVAPKLDLDYVNPRASSADVIDFELKAFGNWSSTTNPGSIVRASIGGRSAAYVAMNEAFLGKITETQRDALLNQYRTQDNRDQIRDELLANPFTQQYNLTLSGGSQRMSNNVSLLFEDNQSNFKNSDNRRYTFTYRTDADIFKWLEFNFSGLVNYNKYNNSGVNYDEAALYFQIPNPLAQIQNIDPYQLLRNPDGSLTDISAYYKPTISRLVPTALFPYSDWGYNPIQEIANRKLTSEEMNLRLQAGLRFKLIKGLTFDSKVQYELFNTYNRNFFNENTFRVRKTVNEAASWNQTTNAITLNLPKGGILDQNRGTNTAYNFRNQLNFDRRIGEKHEVNVVAGSEISNIVFETFGNPTTYGYNEQTLSVGTFPNGPGTSSLPLRNWLGNSMAGFGYTNTFSSATDRYFSLFGNAAYTYNDRYTLSGSIRTDASNLITDDPSYRYAPFWSVGLGWQLSKEEFMRDLGWVDRLSLRATYGYNGNVDRSTSFRPLLSRQPNPNFFTGDRTATVSSFGNPSLRWEKTGTWNLGADYSLFRGALYGKVDVYHKSGKDLIATITIPSVAGTSTQKLNNAEMTNRGIELELGTFQKIKGNDITWRGNLNFAYNKNKITKLFAVTYDSYTMALGGTGAYVEGADANTLWRYQYTGLKNTQPTVMGPNGTIYDFAAFIPGDGRTYMLNTGTSVAPYILGFTNAFQIYDFNLSFILTGKFGHVFQRTGFNYPGSGGLPNSKLKEVMNADPSKMIPLPQNQIEPRYYFWETFYPNVSYLIESASHVRMQEVNLSYNLPSKLTTKLGMNRLQVFAQGNDLFTIIGNNAGEDPEYPIGRINPQPRMTLGFKCEF